MYRPTYSNQRFYIIIVYLICIILLCDKKVKYYFLSIKYYENNVVHCPFSPSGEELLHRHVYICL